jgi:DNA-binding transcriptional regulator LsrR (DeoR family)
MVGRLGAQVLRGVLRDGDIVGIGDGASMSAVADALDEGATPVAATVVPLAGGYWSPGPERDPFRRIADAFGAQPHGLMAPGLLDDAITRDALAAHAGVQAVIDLWGRLDVAVFGIGGRSWGVASVGDVVARRLDEAGAVGEVLIAPYDLGGRFVGTELRERVLAFDARALAQVPTSIGIGAGDSKVRPILGALRAGMVRTLVTDVGSAEAVLALDAAEPAAAGEPR